MTEQQSAPDLGRILAILRRRVPVIVLVVVIATAAAFLYSKSQSPRYESKASVLTNDQGFANQTLGTSADIDPVRSGVTNLELAQRPDVKFEAESNLRSSGVDFGDATVTVSAEDQGDVLDFTASASTAILAARVANAYATAFISLERTAQRRQISIARSNLSSQLNRLPNADTARVNDLRRAIADRLSTLETLSALTTTNQRVVQGAERPTSPVSPTTAKNTVVGFVLGILLALALVVVLEQLDRRVRTMSSAEAAYGLPLLGAVEARPKRAAVNAGDLALTEAARRIRANIRFSGRSHPLRTIAVVSALPGEGKSTIARYLAAADPSERTLLVDADLRRGTLGAQSDSGGLSTLLTRETDDVAVVGGGDQGPDLLPSGPVPSNPTGLLVSPRMRTIVEDSASRYDLVVVDTPALGVVADAIPLLAYCEGVIVVCRLGVAQRDAALRLKAQLDAVGAPVLGLVVNGVRATSRSPYQ